MLIAFVGWCWPARAEPVNPPPRRVILMIADGAGFNTFRAINMYEGHTQVYDGDGWVRLAAITYPLHTGNAPMNTGTQDANVVYDPAKAWNVTPLDPRVQSHNYPDRFQGYAWSKNTYTDSAASATLMATGVRTYNGAVNVDDFGQPLKTLPAIAKDHGLSAGVVTTVEWSHATPACLGGAHSLGRGDMAAIANDMLTTPTLDVIIGGGHPEFDANGQALFTTKPEQYAQVGGEPTWKLLKAGTHPGGWTLVETRAAFENLAQGPTPSRVLGTAQVSQTLQERRAHRCYPIADKPGFDLPVKNVPDLATMTRGALNVLDDNPRGFYLMVEGGAVDWALHENDAVRMLEEMADFVRTVEAVVAWIEAHGGWDNTLLIITADHDHFFWGPDSDTKPFAPLEDRGPGKVPGLMWHSNTHSNHLVPVYARGLRADSLRDRTIGDDPVHGAYLDLGDLFHVMHAVVTEEAGE